MHQVRRKTIRLLDAEDLRVLVAQEVGLDVLVPRVLVRLERIVSSIDLVDAELRADIETFRAGARQ